MYLVQIGYIYSLNQNCLAKLESSFVGKKKMSVASIMSQTSDETTSVSSVTMEAETQPTNQVEDVLVISLGNDIECPGMMSEQKVCHFCIALFFCKIIVLQELF